MKSETPNSCKANFVFSEICMGSGLDKKCVAIAPPKKIPKSLFKQKKYD